MRSSFSHAARPDNTSEFQPVVSSALWRVGEAAFDEQSPFHNRSARLTRRAVLAAPFILSGCASEIVEAPNGRSLRKLEAARVDPVQAKEWLNAYRAEAGLAPVRIDDEFIALAQAQAEAMAAADRMSHDVNGSFAARLAAAGARAVEAGENICAGYYST